MLSELNAPNQAPRHALLPPHSNGYIVLKTIATGIAVACLVGCVTPKFDTQRVSQLEPGVSTLSDAVRLLGQPTSRSAASGGALVQWMDIQGSVFQKRGAHIAILFDGSDKMVRVVHQFETQ